MELTITYTIEVTEVIKDAGTINAVLADAAEDIAFEQERNLRDGCLNVDDLRIRDVKRFLREENE